MCTDAAKANVSSIAAGRDFCAAIKSDTHELLVWGAEHAMNATKDIISSIGSESDAKAVWIKDNTIIFHTVNNSLLVVKTDQDDEDHAVSLVPNVPCGRNMEDISTVQIIERHTDTPSSNSDESPIEEFIGVLCKDKFLYLSSITGRLGSPAHETASINVTQQHTGWVQFGSHVHVSATACRGSKLAVVLENSSVIVLTNFSTDGNASVRWSSSVVHTKLTEQDRIVDVDWNSRSLVILSANGTVLGIPAEPLGHTVWIHQIPGSLLSLSPKLFISGSGDFGMVLSQAEVKQATKIVLPPVITDTLIHSAAVMTSLVQATTKAGNLERFNNPTVSVVAGCVLAVMGFALVTLWLKHKHIQLMQYAAFTGRRDGVDERGIDYNAGNHNTGLDPKQKGHYDVLVVESSPTSVQDDFRLGTAADDHFSTA